MTNGSCILPTGKPLVITSSLLTTQMTQNRDAKIATPNINLPTTISRNSKLITTSEKLAADNNHVNLLYTTPLADTFTTDYSDEDKLNKAVEKVKEQLMASKDGDDEVEGLIMIDIIQRLGIDNYVENEINDVLNRHYEKNCVMGQVIGDNLHVVALRFRLLRRAGGYHVVASDTFMKFTDSNGKFNPELGKDIRGLISLFEASHMSMLREDILDEANDFSRKLLTIFSRNSEQLQAKLIRNTLENPCQRSLPRLIGKSFLHDMKPFLEFLHNIKTPNHWTNNLYDVARIDCRLAQIIYQSEITQISRWWIHLHLSETMKLARDQPVKWYMWSLAALPSPNMGDERIQLTKIISLIYIMDDIFDVYGSLEEVTLFTEANNRWDYDDKNLPDYMKAFLRVLHDTINEISHEIYDKHGLNPKKSIQKAWTDLCNAFLIEAKWFAFGETPSTKEYLKNGIVSTGLLVVSELLSYQQPQLIHGKSMICLNNLKDVARSAASILRLWDDLGSAKDENQEGHDGSFIDCYLKEHEGSYVESARDKINELISEAWKCINQKYSLSSINIPMNSANPLEACHNLAKMVPLMYSYDDNHRLPGLERHMQNVLYENFD